MSSVPSSPHIVIIGAGSMGLATGLQLLEQKLGRVTIITEKTTPHTTSDQAGALWRPFGEVSAENVVAFKRWGRVTFDYLNELRLNHGVEKTGISLVSGFEVFSKPLTQLSEPFWKDDVLNFRLLDQQELRKNGLKYGSSGYFYTSIIVQMNTYLAFLHKEFTRLGGEVVLGTVSTLTDVTKRFPTATLIMNCTGLSAAELVKDASTFPVAGHIVKIEAKNIQHFYLDEEKTAYVFPRYDGTVICGGTYFKHSDDTRPNIENRVKIINKCADLVHEVKDAPIACEYVGLRPYRDVTRLELELPSSTSKSAHPKLPLIHNYGHGGSGITLHIGCAEDSVQLAKKVLNQPRSKL